MAITTCIFDAYGTLFDVTAAARSAAGETGRKKFASVWQDVAKEWRLKQLQYSWIRALTDHHTDFWQVTQDSLDWALEAAELDDAELRERLLALYWELTAFAEVPEMLLSLKTRGYQTGILSNGSRDMLDGAVQSAGLGELLDAVLNVDDVEIFKPHKSVYEMVPARLNCRNEEVLFVSSNGWDVAAATGFGFQTVWVNRSAEPMDRLPWKPNHVLGDLSGIPELVAEL